MSDESHHRKMKREIVSALVAEERNGGGNLTKGEIEAVKWQFPDAFPQSDYRKILWELIVKSDHENLRRLELAFPDDVQGFRSWREGDLAKRLADTPLGAYL